MKKKSQDSEESMKIGLDAATRSQAVSLLSTIVADQHVLYLKTRNFHWNLRGPRFHSLHEFFEKQYQTLEMLIDKTAERIRMIGGTSPGSMAEFLEITTLKETPGKLIHGDDAVSALCDDHEAAVRELRKAIDRFSDLGDAGTEDFVTSLLQAHEETAWMLRSLRD